MSKVVFVGNVPYNMGEEQLIEVFKSVGQVIGFRLVYDRETGKPKGYGFCEFADHETATSAVRNLNNADVGGRPLRIDLADSDPFLEGKTTVRGEILDGGGETRAQWRERERRERDGNPRNDPTGFLKQLPPGTTPGPGKTSLDAISHTLATMNPAQLTEVLAQMKAFVINHTEHARMLLVAHPQLAYALFQALLLNKIVDSAILQRMLAATLGQNGAVAATSQPPTPMHPSTHVPPMMGQTHTPTPPMPSAYQTPYHQMPPQVPPQAMPPPPAQTASYYRPPPSAQAPPAPIVQPPPATSAPSVQPNLPPGMDPSQRDMILQVLALTPDKIAALPAAERDAIQQLRNQFLGASASLPR